jgi:hypothetical protein
MNINIKSPENKKLHKKEKERSSYLLSNDAKSEDNPKRVLSSYYEPSEKSLKRNSLNNEVIVEESNAHLQMESKSKEDKMCYIHSDSHLNMVSKLLIYF